ncbi:MAG: chromate resistance protein ChrB domain-containing protein [Betaproteobacteria bacterium]
MKLDAAVTPLELKQRLAAFPPPTLVDVRRPAVFDADPAVIPGAIKRDPGTIAEWADGIEPWRPVVVYCAHGHELSQNDAASLRARGLDARSFDGGLDAWRAAGLATVPYAPPTRWVTRERPKIDRIACPWLVRRFVDPSAEFFYVPPAQVRSFAAANGATAYDIPDVPYSHVGPECSFDAFIRRHKLDHPALATLAKIVRGADTGVLDLAPQAPGLVAASLGLSALFADDHAMLKWGMLVYDALYEWCRQAQAETHGWYPEKLRSLEAA